MGVPMTLWMGGGGGKPASIVSFVVIVRAVMFRLLEEIVSSPLECLSTIETNILAILSA